MSDEAVMKCFLHVNVELSGKKLDCKTKILKSEIKIRFGAKNNYCI
jgi:hypothetical protein